MSYLNNEGQLYRATVSVEVLFRADALRLGGFDKEPRELSADQAAAWHAASLLSFFYAAAEHMTQAGQPYIGMDLEVSRLERLTEGDDIEPDWAAIDAELRATAESES